MRAPLVVLVASLASSLAAALGAGTADADPDPPFSIGGRPAWFLLGGVSGGANLAIEGEEGGGFAGGELSLVRLREGRFFGLYVDGAYDFGAGATTLSAGPELGFHLRSDRPLPISFAVDAGPALRVDGEASPGAAARLSATLFGLLSIYGRTIYVDADEGELAFQAGVLLKFPLTSPLGADPEE
jgi:hypothetical protein